MPLLNFDFDITEVKKPEHINWIKLWGCPGCGSEFTVHEKRKQRGKCRFCDYNGNLEYLGMFDSESLYPIS